MLSNIQVRSILIRKELRHFHYSPLYFLYHLVVIRKVLPYGKTPAFYLPSSLYRGPKAP